MLWSTYRYFTRSSSSRSRSLGLRFRIPFLQSGSLLEPDLHECVFLQLGIAMTDAFASASPSLALLTPGAPGVM